MAAGYVLAWDAFVSSTALATTDAAAEKHFQIRQNFPNPCVAITSIPVVLRTPSDVRVSVRSLDGREVLRQALGTLGAGDHLVDLNLSALAAGNYLYQVKVANLSGTFTQSNLLTKH
ncbi:T9SS type A sorting domain-containing protein [Hymenobacter sp. ASUV-10]|uniref:T9SS type A sorting domain-containing protein n=1 Tax=Hymenobacter aranciens TaxID=3063996 RepID=A0ABT9B839_9BACT|nr:T9SS type A sorting domain-containing protein [Hymenobacter sp. ASUV-10]MDO7874447.1 T9SS type A sorting domain-containing protein [Hymenobacter sp. ASUV-10]